MANHQVKEVSLFKTGRFHTTTLADWEDNNDWENPCVHSNTIGSLLVYRRKYFC